MKRSFIVILTVLAMALPLVSQTPPAPAPPPTDRKAEPARPEKAEQEPRPVEQEIQKQESQQNDALPPVQPAPAPTAAQTPPVDPEAKEEKKWDVMNPPGPTFDVALDVTEGTWMSLDVSPDGREIAFDLLGDIYMIPIQRSARTGASRKVCRLMRGQPRNGAKEL